MGRKKKLRCLNCGTALKEDEKSCPICHMVVEHPEEEQEEEKEFVIKQEFPVGKVFMLIFILIGIILTIKGIDRKSTRLNSSHPRNYFNYICFCSTCKR